MKNLLSKVRNTIQRLENMEPRLSTHTDSNLLSNDPVPFDTCIDPCRDWEGFTLLRNKSKDNGKGKDKLTPLDKRKRHNAVLEAFSKTEQQGIRFNIQEFNTSYKANQTYPNPNTNPNTNHNPNPNVTLPPLKTNTQNTSTNKNKPIRRSSRVKKVPERLPGILTGNKLEKALSSSQKEVSHLHLSDLKKGMFCWVLDIFKNDSNVERACWRYSQIIDLDSSNMCLKIHFLGWSNKWDLWIPFKSIEDKRRLWRISPYDYTSMSTKSIINVGDIRRNTKLVCGDCGVRYYETRLTSVSGNKEDLWLSNQTMKDIYLHHKQIRNNPSPFVPLK
jgi:hypothetical protein